VAAGQVPAAPFGSPLGQASCRGRRRYTIGDVRRRLSPHGWFTSLMVLPKIPTSGKIGQKWGTLMGLFSLRFFRLF
jgi:hypothetical protein